MPRKKNSFKQPPREYAPRRVGVRTLMPRFLIVCEGEKTEINYFEGFRVRAWPFKLSPLALVERALELKAKSEAYDEVWCVFDRDDIPYADFNQAITFAKRHKVNVAYSNEAFELWYLLHFNYHDAAISRKAYADKLTELLGYEYKKNSSTMYETLESRQKTAIRNARKLLAQYTPCNPAKDNPSTTVHLLVEALNKFIR